MTVYIDTMRSRVGRLVLCRMIADTEGELHAMADRLRIARRWHLAGCYHVPVEQRDQAIAAGAVPATATQLGAMQALRRNGDPAAPLVPPDRAEAAVAAPILQAVGLRA